LLYKKKKKFVLKHKLANKSIKQHSRYVSAFHPVYNLFSTDFLENEISKTDL